MKTVTIDRQKWIRGSVSDITTVLWNSTRKMGCCLGHAIHQISRCSWDSLNNIVQPEDYFDGTSFLTVMHREENTRTPLVNNNKFAAEAMCINDSLCIDDEEREKKLIKLFKQHKIKLVFIN